MHPLERVEQRDEGFGAERERVHLRGDEQNALFLEQRGHHLDDIARRQRVQQGLKAELVGEREAVRGRHDDFDEFVEDDHLQVRRALKACIELERRVQRGAEVHKIADLTLHGTLHDQGVIGDVARRSLAEH